MKEIAIFLGIMILALVIFFAIDRTDSGGADLLGAFKFDYVNLSGLTTKDKDADVKINKNTVKVNYSSSQAVQYNTSVRLPWSSSVVQAEYSPSVNLPWSSSIETADYEKEGLSKYYQKIRITSVSRGGSNYPSTINLYASTNQSINITGFTIRARHGEFKIPEGTEKYRGIETDKDITVRSNMNIKIITDQSPLATNAFRTNICFGYLQKKSTSSSISIWTPFQSTSQIFYSSCPRPKIEDVSHLHPYCQDYILKLGTCQIPDYSKDLKIASNSYCTSYITENLNYPGCYENFNEQNNFLGNTWYIYTNSDIIEPLHDKIYLYDRQGLLVDEYSY